VPITIKDISGISGQFLQIGLAEGETLNYVFKLIKVKLYFYVMHTCVIEENLKITVSLENKISALCVFTSHKIRM
jgi:hypothetical protein